MINESNLLQLREHIKVSMSGRRAVHTLEVEQMAIRLGEIYAPAEIYTLRAAALLHDITKELNTDEHIVLCEKYAVQLEENDIYAPKTLHARTAAAIIPYKYPEFATDGVLSAVRWHTTGREGMALSEKIIYLADYIDMSRTFDDCIKLRNYFFGFDFENATFDEKISHLNDTLLMSYDMTITALLAEKSPVAKDTINARNQLVCEKLKANKLKG